MFELCLSGHFTLDPCQWHLLLFELCRSGIFTFELCEWHLYVEIVSQWIVTFETSH